MIVELAEKTDGTTIIVKMMENIVPVIRSLPVRTLI